MATCEIKHRKLFEIIHLRQ